MTVGGAASGLSLQEWTCPSLQGVLERADSTFDLFRIRRTLTQRPRSSEAALAEDWARCKSLASFAHPRDSSSRKLCSRAPCWLGWTCAKSALRSEALSGQSCFFTVLSSQVLLPTALLSPSQCFLPREPDEQRQDSVRVWSEKQNH